MKDQDKTREQLIEELTATRQRVAEMQGRLQRLEAAESEHQQTAEALRQSEERLKRVLETLPVGVWIMDEEGTITHGNPAGQQIWAGARYVGPERFGDYKGWWLDTGERIKPEEWGVARAIAKGEVSLEEEIEIECFDGSRKKILNWAVPILGPNQEIKGAVAVNQDITARVRAAEELRLHSEIMANMAEGVYLVRTSDGVIVYANPTFEEMFGYGPGEMIGKHVSVVNFPTEKRPEETAREIMRILDRTGVWRGQVNNIKQDGTPFWCYANVSTFDHPGYGRVLVAVHTDITERKKAVEVLRASEEKYRELIEALQEGIWSIDKDACTTFVNRPMAEMLGYTVDEMLVRRLFEFMDERGVEIATRNLERRQQGITEQHDFEFTRKDGARIYTRIATTPITDEDGNYAGALAGVMDITERVQAEEALRQSEEQFRVMFESSHDLLTIADESGKTLLANPAWRKTLGYTPETQDDPVEKIHPDDRARVIEARQAMARGEDDFIDLEYRYKTASGEYVSLEATIRDLKVTGRPLISIVCHDITERVRAEEELRQSEARWRSLTETSPDHILTLDTDLNIQFANFASPGLTVQDLIGAPLYTFVEKERQAEIKAILKGVLRTGQDASYETVYGAPDGSIIHYESRVTPRRLAGSDEIIGLTLSARDITARVRAEEQIKAALEEKEALLRELYHRTKNNMQVISSMLALQAVHIQDEQVLSIFREVENRIQAMALVHQKLYQSQDLSRIDLQDYIADLVKLLTQSYRVPLGKIALVVDIEHALVLIDTAIPCGLVLNELLSNVFKHAFPGDRAGEVKLCLQRTQDGTLTLQVSDNGVGFPEGLDLRKSDTLGLQTVFGIAERQLRGKVAVETGRGVTWHIKFREDFYSPRV